MRTPLGAWLALALLAAPWFAVVSAAPPPVPSPGLDERPLERRFAELPPRD